MENLKGKNLCDPGKFMRHRRLPTNSVTHPGIMALKPNVVWVGCPDPECKKMVAIKKCEEHEYIVQKNMKKAFPNIVPDVYEGVPCFDGFYMYSEFIEDGTLKKHKNDPRVDTFVHKVFVELRDIHTKFPSFRHNDLHVDNVLIKGTTPLIYDFGFANWHGNPMFDPTLKRDYGIYAGNHPMYDFHFFVNSISADLPKRFKDKALSVFPKEYIGENSSVVKNWRLRSDVKHPNIPNMDQVIRAFSSVANIKNMNKGKRAPRVLTFTNASKKKTNVSAVVPKKSTVKFSLANKRRVSNRKAELIRKGMNNVQAELKAIRNIELLKTAGLLTPSPSPTARKSPAKMMSILKRGGAPKRSSNSPRPNLTFTLTPQRRPRIGKKLCTSYKKDELMALARKFGHRVDKRMSVKEICKKFTPAAGATVSVAVYTRPIGNVAVNVRKTTYSKHLKKNLYALAKNVGVKPLSKNKKEEIISKLYKKLNKNISNVLSTSNRKTVTARQVSEKLAKNYKWKNDRYIERLRLLKIYGNKK
jgi:serine/threonine-protein kinase RIO1